MVGSSDNRMERGEPSHGHVEKNIKLIPADDDRRLSSTTTANGTGYGNGNNNNGKKISPETTPPKGPSPDI